MDNPQATAAALIWSLQIEHHCRFPHSTEIGKKFGMSGEYVARIVQRRLVQRRGYEAVDTFLLRQFGSQDHCIVGGLATSRISDSWFYMSCVRRACVQAG
jgi:hypothetical protein